MHLALDGRTIKNHPSGLGIWNIRLIEELLRTTDYRISVIVSRDFNYRFPETARLQIIPLSARYQFISLRRILVEQFELPRLLQSLSPDLFHATDSWGIPAALPGHIKTVLTVHDLIPMTPYREMMSAWEYHLLYRPSVMRSLSKADAVVAISDNTRDDLVKYCRVPAGKIQVINDGIDNETLVREAGLQAPFLRPYGLRENRYILYVGGFGTRRNVPTAIRVFHDLLKSGTIARDTKLVLSGRIKNAKSEALKNLNSIRSLIARLGLDTSVVLLDYLPVEIKDALIRHSLFVISLSLYEGFGLAPLESLQQGKETYLSRVGIMKSYAGSSPFVIENPLSVTEIVHKIRANLKVSSRRQNDLESLTAFVRGFSWSQMAASYVGLYQALLHPPQ